MGNVLTYEHLNQVYDPEADIWTTGTIMPTPRFAFAIAVINDTLYAIGGSADTSRAILNEKYIPIGYIPEFPSWAILPLLITATLAVIIVKQRLFKTPTN